MNTDRLTTLFVVARMDAPGMTESPIAVKEIPSTEVEAAAEVERLTAAWPGCSVRFERPAMALLV